ncbi:hypothetical protein ACIRU3_05675 [Streptomyces sp. NPDC101151]|uniref:hypothetical protein n=1 Tax=Streptomyces sp. NPDC101151 TaxID=3366115 RepID=UPI0037FCE024
MWIPVAVTALLLLLATASAVFQARKGRWLTAASVFLPSLGAAALLGGVTWQSGPLFSLAVVFVAAGFGAEATACWRTRTAGGRQVDQ